VYLNRYTWQSRGILHQGRVRGQDGGYKYSTRAQFLDRWCAARQETKVEEMESYASGKLCYSEKTGHSNIVRALHPSLCPVRGLTNVERPSRLRMKRTTISPCDHSEHVNLMKGCAAITRPSIGVWYDASMSPEPGSSELNFSVAASMAITQSWAKYCICPGCLGLECRGRPGAILLKDVVGQWK
jgi:hypothetical protein